MPSGWAIWKQELFGKIPWPIRPLIAWYIRRGAAKALNTNGMARHSEEEVKGFLREFMANLDARLGSSSSPYLFGATPALADIVVYSFLASILATQANPFQTALILESSAIRSYVARCTRDWHPEYKRVLGLVE
jgi:glutathione S-transferase